MNAFSFLFPKQNKQTNTGSHQSRGQICAGLLETLKKKRQKRRSQRKDVGPVFDGGDGFLGRVVIVGLHGAVHVGQLHLGTETRSFLIGRSQEEGGGSH